MNLWIDVSAMASLFAVGNILFGQFEEKTPKWRRVLKFFIMTGAVTILSATAGRAWSVGFVGSLLAVATVIHGWWLPKHGVNGLTGEPEEKYYAPRGWQPWWTPLSRAPSRIPGPIARSSTTSASSLH